MESACIRDNNRRCYTPDGDRVLFKCIEGFPVNSIKVEDYFCNQCMDGGAGKSDYCA
jgi:hypothetical protein